MLPIHTVSSLMQMGDTLSVQKVMLDQKLALIKKTYEEHAIRLAPIQYDIQFARARAYADLTFELTDMRAKIEGCAKELSLIAGYDVQPYSEVFTSSEEIKKLEVELELLLMKIIELQKRASSAKYRSQELEERAEAREFPVRSIVPINPSYKFWKNVPYTMQYSYSAPHFLRGGWYQNTGYLGNELEKIGHPVADLLQQLDARFIQYQTWNESIEALATRIQGLFTTFKSLKDDVDRTPRDELSVYVDEYVSGLKYAFKEAYDKLKVLEECSKMPLGDLVAIFKDVQAYSLMPNVLGIHFDVLKFLKVVSALKDIAEKIPKNPSCFAERFTVRFYERLQAIQLRATRHFVELNINEQEVPEKVFSNQHVMPDLLMSYTVKRMLHAVWVAPDFDMHLALVLAVIPNPIESFNSLKELCESYKATCTRMPEVMRAAGAFVKELYTSSEMNIYVYAKFWQRFFETPEFISDKELQAALVRHLEIIARRHKYPLLDPQVLDLQENQALERFIATQLMPARDVVREDARKFTCNSLLFRFLCCALFGGDAEARNQAQERILRIIEDAQFENVLIDLDPNVRELLHKLILVKCTLFPQSTLGLRELRLFSDGPIDSFFSQTTIDFESYDIQLALFRFIHDKSKHFRVDVTRNHFKKVYRDQFDRWYQSFIMANGAKCIHRLPDSAIAYNEEAIRCALECIPAYKEKVDKTLWDAVIAKDFGDEEHKMGIALRAQAYLFSHLSQSIESKQLDVELDLFLYSIRKDPECKFILQFFVRMFESSALLQQYEHIFRPSRCDVLLQEASDVLASIINSIRNPYDMYFYAKAWQQGIDFCRQAGQEGIDPLQHTALTRFIFSRLEALASKTGFILLENEQRYVRLEQNVEADCSPIMLFRLISTCLFGTDAHEVLDSQSRLSKFLELGDTSKIPIQMMPLIYENTAEKILKGNFEIGKKEKQFFFGGPVTRIIRDKKMILSDIKVLHALYCLLIEEQNSQLKPFSTLLLQSGVNIDEFLIWGQKVRVHF